jgi:hypothetical protein
MVSAYSRRLAIPRHIAGEQVPHIMPHPIMHREYKIAIALSVAFTLGALVGIAGQRWYDTAPAAVTTLVIGGDQPLGVWTPTVAPPGALP